MLLEQRALPQRRLDQRLGRGLAVLLEQPLVQRAGVDADADRDAGVAGGLGDLPTLSSNALMLPGLTRTAAQPASIAAKTYLGWKWMSAITGICDLRGDGRQRVGVVLGRAGDPHDLAAGRGQLGDLLQRRVDVGSSASSSSTAPRRERHRRPARRRRRSGARPGACASGRGGVSGMPRRRSCRTSARHASLARAAARASQIGRRRAAGVIGLTMSAVRVSTVSPPNEQDHEVGQRQQLVVVDPARVRPAAPGRQPGPGPLVPGDRDVAAVERQQREQVEDADEDVQPAEQDQEDDRRADLGRPRRRPGWRRRR